jgi:hypothetical protein
MALNPNMEATEPAVVVAYKLGDVLMTGKVAPAPTEDTNGAKLIGMAEKATATEPKALEPLTEGVGWHDPNIAPQNNLAKSDQVLQALPLQGNMGTHGCRCDTVPQHGAIESGQMCNVVWQLNSNKYECMLRVLLL